MGKVEPVYFYNGVWEKKGKRMKFHLDINTRHLNLNLRLKRVVKGRHWYFDDFYHKEYCRIPKPIKNNRWQRNRPKREFPF